MPIEVLLRVRGHNVTYLRDEGAGLGHLGLERGDPVAGEHGVHGDVVQLVGEHHAGLRGLLDGHEARHGAAQGDGQGAKCLEETCPITTLLIISKSLKLTYGKSSRSVEVLLLLRLVT